MIIMIWFKVAIIHIISVELRIIYIISLRFIIIVKTPTPTQHNTTVGFDHKMTVQTTPPNPHTNFSATSRPARELKFGTDIH